MTGAYANQSIWVLNNGVTTTITLEGLWQAYLNDTLPNFQVWCFDPEEFQKPEDERGPMIYTKSIPYVTNHHLHQLVSILTEDELKVTVPAAGFMMDISERAPMKNTYLNTRDATNTGYYVCALEELGQKPGDVQFVRRVIDYALGYGCVMSLPVPNMIADTGFVIIP